VGIALRARALELPLQGAASCGALDAAAFRGAEDADAALADVAGGIGLRALLNNRPRRLTPN